MTNLEYIKLHPQEFSELDHKLIGVLGLYMIDYGYTIDDILSDKILYNDKGINDIPITVRDSLRELLKERNE